MWSFPGFYANRGSGTQLASSDAVVPVAGLEPARDRSQGILSLVTVNSKHVLSKLMKAATR